MILEKWNESIAKIRDAITKCTSITDEQFNGAVHALLSRGQKIHTIKWLANFEVIGSKEKATYKKIINRELKKLENYHIALTKHGDKSIEIYINCRLKHTLPHNVQTILYYMFGERKASFRNVQANLPYHPFFETSNWRYIGQQAGYIGDPRDDGEYPYKVRYNNYMEWYREDNDERITDRHLISLSTICDAMGEGDKFFDWIDEYVYEEPGRFIGYWYNRMGNTPTFVYKK